MQLALLDTNTGDNALALHCVKDWQEQTYCIPTQALETSPQMAGTCGLCRKEGSMHTNSPPFQVRAKHLCVIIGRLLALAPLSTVYAKPRSFENQHYILIQGIWLPKGN